LIAERDVSDEDEAVRYCVADALGGIGDPHAFDPLIHALGDEECRVRHSAALALGRIGDDRAVPHLYGLLEHDSQVRSAAALAIRMLCGTVGNGEGTSCSCRSCKRPTS